MNKIYTALTALILIAYTGCSTVDQNVKARKNIGKCKFDFSGIEFNKLNMGEKGPASIDLTALLTIANPNDSDVVVDHVNADIYLEQKKVGTLQHKNFVRIKAGSSAVERIAVNVPFSAGLLLTGKRPETLTIDATVYINILVGNYTLPTPAAMPVKKTVPVPWDKIDRDLSSKKENVSGKIKKFLK